MKYFVKLICKDYSLKLLSCNKKGCVLYKIKKKKLTCYKSEDPVHPKDPATSIVVPALHA